MSGTGNSGTKLRADIEGLRAVAVGVVLLFHVGIPGVSGGFAGVDIFFVISGYLITSLLLRELSQSGRVLIGRFYARRARRLLPAATLVLLFTAFVGWKVLPGSQHHFLAVDVASAALYFVNWALADRSVDYLAEDAMVSPLQHYWSLSIEEQYYLFWPLIIFVGAFGAKRLGLKLRRPLLVLTAVVGIASLVYSIVHTASSPATAYFFTTTRIWELALGSLLAFATSRLAAHLTVQAAALLATIGLGMIAWSVFVFSSSTPWPGASALVPTVGAALIIAAGCRSEDTLVARALGLSPMVWLGSISYALYLWHWPLLVLGEAQWPGLRIRHKVLIGILAILLAWATKHLLEDPVRFHRRLIPTGASLAVGATAMALSLAAAHAVNLSVPTLDTSVDVAGAASLRADASGATWTVRDDPESVYNTSGPVVPAPAVAPTDIPWKECQLTRGQSQIHEECVAGDLSGDVTIAVLGDSKMGQWIPALDEIGKEEGWRFELYLKSACTVSIKGVDEECAEFNQRVFEHLRDKGTPDHVVVSVRGSSYDHDSNGFTESMERIAALDTDVVLLADNPAPIRKEHVYDCVEANPDNYAVCDFDRKAAIELSGYPLMLETAEALQLPMINLANWTCPAAGGQCPPVIGGTLIYRQGSHLTATYIGTLAPVLRQEFLRFGMGESRASQR